MRRLLKLQGISSSVTFTSRAFISLLFLVAFMAAFGRWLTISVNTDSFRDDPDVYLRFATVWADTGVYGTVVQPPLADAPSANQVVPSAFRPPLYPFLIKTFALRASPETNSHRFDKNRMLVLHVLLSTLTALGVAVCFVISFDKLQVNAPKFLKYPFAFLSAAVITFDPILVRQSQLLMTETLATLLCLVVVALFIIRETVKQEVSWRSEIAWGIAIGLAWGGNILCRPTSLAWLLLYVFVSLIHAIYGAIRERTRKRSRGSAAETSWLSISCLWGPQGVYRAVSHKLLFLIFLSATAFGMLIPWAIRNQSELGHWYLTTTHGGYTLLLANNNSLYDHYNVSWSRDWDESPFFLEWAAQNSRAPNEVDADRLANSLAKQVIFSRPADFMEAAIVRMGWLWAPWPNQGGLLTKVVVGLWYGVLYAGAFLAIIQILRSGAKNRYTRDLWLPGFCLVVSLTLVHAVYWSNMRMRSVALPTVVLLAMVGFCSVIGSLYRVINKAS